MASLVHISPLEDTTAHEAVQAITQTLLAPLSTMERKTLFLRHDFRGPLPLTVSVCATYERDPRTKQNRPVNFDVITSSGPVRCGSSAFAAAALCYGLGVRP